MLQLLVVASVFVAAGAGLALLGMRVQRAVSGFNRRAVGATGVVVGSRPSLMYVSSTPKTVHFTRVRFSTHDGRSVELDGLGEAIPATVGSTRPLLYDAADPQQVSFTGPRGQANIGAVLVVLGGLLLLGGFALGALGLYVR